jgi:phosphatidylglycerol:prolipoprotein diacylglycerol transferase
MHPHLITTPFFVLPTFGLFLASAYLAALWYLLRGAKREGVNADRVTGLGLWIIVGAILGAKAMMVIRFFPDYVANPSDFLSLATLQSAGDFYGGFIAAIFASILYFRRHRELKGWQIADLSAPAIALGQGIGRIGCFMAGDDYGKPTDLSWAVVFRHPAAAEIGGAPLGIPLHPVQIYESILCFIFFGFLVWLRRRKRFDGEIILNYAMLYAAARFFLEYFRGDVDRGFVLGGLFSTSQFLAIVIILICVPLFFRRKSSKLQGR